MSALLYTFFALQIVYFVVQNMMSNSPELEAVRKCTPDLETALKVPDRNLVHFLEYEGFFSDDVHDDILNPRSMLTEMERAGELVKWIKNRVKQDPGSFHILLHCFKQSVALYKPIVNKLSAEYRIIVASGAESGGIQPSSPSCPFQLTHEAEKHEIASDLTGSQPSLPSSPSQNTVSHRQPDETTPQPLPPSTQTSQLPIVQTPQPPETHQQMESVGEYFRV